MADDFQTFCILKSHIHPGSLLEVNKINLLLTCLDLNFFFANVWLQVQSLWWFIPSHLHVPWRTGHGSVRCDGHPLLSHLVLLWHTQLATWRRLGTSQVIVSLPVSAAYKSFAVVVHSHFKWLANLAWNIVCGNLLSKYVHKIWFLKC